MFSATVSDSNSAKCWNTIAMPRPRAATGSGIDTGAPRHSIAPASGWTTP